MPTMHDQVTAAEALERGREAYAGQAWSAAFALLSAADRDRLLELADLERLAETAYLLGRNNDVADLLARAHNAALRLREPVRAARRASGLASGY
jgi:hypothetical protein